MKRYTLIGPNGAPYVSATPGTLGGHKATRLYGRLDCPSALRALANGGYVTHRVFFADEKTAVAAGYRDGARHLLRPAHDRAVAPAGTRQLDVVRGGRELGLGEVVARDRGAVRVESPDRVLGGSVDAVVQDDRQEGGVGPVRGEERRRVCGALTLWI